jgi:hypothetical protein
MRRLILLLLALCCALPGAVAPRPAHATETDQFTLPPEPLDDLGPDLAAMVLDVLHAEVDALNARIAERAQAGDAAPSPRADERKLILGVFLRTGLGLPESTLERALRYGAFPGRNVRFGPSVADSIYAWVVAPFPFAHVLTDCPTIRLYGVDLGTDKVGHLFQQGYEYYVRYLDARDDGADEAAALAGAVRWGVLTESTLYGLALTGVYSNADLAGNYAGLEFYHNLFHEVRIGERVLPPILRHDGTAWGIDPARDGAELLRPYITLHLNEAFNPSRYLYGVERIRANVRQRCASWLRQVPGFDEAGYRARVDATQTWFGQPYGRDLPDDKAATLLECFPDTHGRADAAPRDGG